MPGFPDQFRRLTKARGFARMTKKKDKPSAEQPADAKPSREDEVRQVVQEYADDQREIIKKLRKPTS